MNEDHIIKYALRVLASTDVMEMAHRELGVDYEAESDMAADLYRARYGEDFGVDTFSAEGLMKYRAGNAPVNAR